MVFGGKKKQTGFDRGFKMSQRKSIIELQDLFILRKNNKGQKAIHSKLLK